LWQRVFLLLHAKKNYEFAVNCYFSCEDFKWIIQRTCVTENFTMPNMFNLVGSKLEKNINKTRARAAGTDVSVCSSMCSLRLPWRSRTNRRKLVSWSKYEEASHEGYLCISQVDSE